jgi:LEA14-like dessication related protein
MLVTVAIVGCAALRPGQELIAPQVHIADLDVLNTGLFEQRFRVTLRVANPNDFDLPLDGLRFGLDINGRHFADGFSPAAVTIPRLGDETITVEAVTSTFDILRQLSTLSRNEAITYGLEGTVFLRSTVQRQLSFAQEGKLELLPTDAVRRLVPSAPSTAAPR